MGWTKKTWRNEVSVNLFEFANLPFQKDLWLNKISGYQSDFDSLINDFDSCGIPDYINDFVLDDFLCKADAKKLLEINTLINKLPDIQTPQDYKLLWELNDWILISSLSSNLFNKSFLKDFKSSKEHELWLQKYPI